MVLDILGGSWVDKGRVKVVLSLNLSLLELVLIVFFDGYRISVF